MALADNDTDQDADEAIRSQERLKTYRSNFEETWTKILEIVLPRADQFNIKYTPGTRREQHVYDSTAQLALPSFAAAMESLLCPRTQKWHNLRPLSEKLADSEKIKAYLEAKRDLLFRIRYSRQANFASQISEVFLGLGSLGTGGLFIEDGLARGPLYQGIPLSELYIQEDAYGIIDTIHRRYPLTVRQAYQKWGDSLPENMLSVREKEPEREFEFLHVVRPNTERKNGDSTYRGMGKTALDIAIEGRKTLQRGGYRCMPYAVSRYVTAPREVYGRSPAWDAFADIRSLNLMGKTSLRAGELAADPPWATADVDSMAPFSMRPGAINPGYLDDRGNLLAKALQPEGDPRFGLELQDQKRQSINRSFLVTLFQILVDTPTMTATEALLRAQEKGALLAPTAGRQQTELLDVIVTRELDIMKAGGVFDDMPEELRAEGGEMSIVYDSPLTRAQMAEEGVGILRTLEAAGSIAQFDESIKHQINGKRTLRRLRDINGAPIDMLNTDEELAAADQAAASEAQMQQLLAAAPVVADTAASLAKTQQAQTAAPF